MFNKIKKIDLQTHSLARIVSESKTATATAIEPLIFTDLDGSLLNHDNYSFIDAWPALRLIAAKSIPLIINSSRALNNQHPFIVENGSAVFIPEQYFPGFNQPLNCVMLGPTRNELLKVLNDLRTRHRFLFESFTDLGPTEIAKLTGLTLMQARMANERIGSEPLRWLGDDKNLNEFKKILTKKGLSLVKGGRFWHVTGRVDKAQAMQWLLKQFQQTRKANFVCVGIGDSDNDRLMLESTDVAVVIKKITGKYLALKKQRNRVIFTEDPGAKGWNEAIEQLFKGTKLEQKHE